MSKRKTGSKPAAQSGNKPGKLTLQASAEQIRLFSVHAAHTGLSKSELFAELVETHCRRFVVSDRGKSDGDQAEAKAKAEAAAQGRGEPAIAAAEPPPATE